MLRNWSVNLKAFIFSHAFKILLASLVLFLFNSAAHSYKFEISLPDVGHAISVSDKHHILYTTLRDKNIVFFWDLNTGKLFKKVKIPFSSYDLSVSKDNKYLVICSTSSADYLLLDPQGGTVIEKRKVPLNTQGDIDISSSVMSIDGDHIISSYVDKASSIRYVSITSIHDNKTICQLDNVHCELSHQSIGTIIDNRFALIAPSYDRAKNGLIVWNILKDELVANLNPDNSTDEYYDIGAFKLSPDKKLLAVSFNNSKLCIWKYPDLKLVRTMNVKKGRDTIYTGNNSFDMSWTSNSNYMLLKDKSKVALVNTRFGGIKYIESWYTPALKKILSLGLNHYIVVYEKDIDIIKINTDKKIKFVAAMYALSFEDQWVTLVKNNIMFGPPGTESLVTRSGKNLARDEYGVKKVFDSITY